MSRTASWPWPHRHAANAVVIFGPDELAYIRSMTVSWNTGEAGATGLADPSFLELDGQSGDELLLTDLFLNSAKMENWNGTVKNPFGQPNADLADQAQCLDDIPDQKVADILRQGEDFEFTADGDSLALWAEANLGGEGINSKRPFGSSNVSDDVRAIIDPEKNLSNAEFSKRRKYLESRLVLMMLRFLQAAELPFGTYQRDENWQWQKQSQDDAASGEDITHEEWVMRLYPGQIYQTRDYIKTMMAAGHLMWEGRLKGDYHVLAEALDLGNFYGAVEYTYSEVPIEDMVNLGLQSFEEKQLKPLTRMMVRILNSQSRFAEAKALLDHAGSVPSQAVDARDGITPELVFQTEAALAQLGLEIAKTGKYLDALGTPGLPGVTWSWLYDILRADPRELAPEADHLAQHMQAAAAQLQFMRGPNTRQ